jgi:hypothetical protein
MLAARFRLWRELRGTVSLWPGVVLALAAALVLLALPLMLGLPGGNGCVPRMAASPAGRIHMSCVPPPP